MAFKEYERTASIQQMNARQLRLYISRSAKEANERLSSLDPNTMPDSMKDIYQDAATHKGIFLSGTSYMSKQQMQDYAQKLRDFNFLDTESRFARDREYEQNYDRYESFIKRQKSRAGGRYWSQYINKDGSVSKEGYQEYKQYLNFIRGILNDIQSYSYDAIRETIGISNVRKRFTEAKENKDPQRMEKVERIIADAYTKNKEKGLQSKDLNAIIIKEIAKLDEKPQQKPKKPKVSKPKASKSKGTNVKVKTGKKMKSGKVREKQGTS